MHTFYQQHFGGQRGRDFLIAMFMGGPAFLLLGLFMIWPVIRGIDLSRTNQRFDGAQATTVGWSNYDKILSVNVIRLPDIPDPLPEEAPAAGWYRSGDGELIFRWRARPGGHRPGPVRRLRDRAAVFHQRQPIRRHR